MEADKNPIPKNLVNWGFIFKGLVEVGFDVVVHRHRQPEDKITYIGGDIALVEVTPENIDRLLPPES